MEGEDDQAFSSPDSSESECEGDSSYVPLEPLGRRGQWSGVCGGKFYVYGGYARGMSAVRRHVLCVFDYSSCEWRKFRTKGTLPKSLSGSCSTIIGDSLFMFGGWYWHRGMRNADVHELSLVDFTWKKLTEDDYMKGSPLCKDKAGMVDYGEMLCITGGYGHSRVAFLSQKGASYHLDTNSSFEIGWTNELHLFRIKSREWITPELTGVRPLPCAAFSFNRVDHHRAVLFGGRQLEERTNQLHILDMEKWHWSGVILPSGPDSPWPSKRSFHAACPLVDPNCSHFSHASPAPPSSERKHLWLPCMAPDLSNADSTEGCGALVDPKLLVLWGMNNDGDPVNDAWILNVNALTWKKVNLGKSGGPGRIWHTAESCHPSSCESLVVAVGGSDENLFKSYESKVHNVEVSSVLNFGVSDLSELVTRFIADNMPVFSPLLKQLPRHIQELIRYKKRMRFTKEHYYTVNCSNLCS